MLHYLKSHSDLTAFSDGVYYEQLNLREFDIIADDPLGYSIVRKIQKIWDGKFVGLVAWPGKPFGLRTNYFKKNTTDLCKTDTAIPCLSRNKIIHYIDPQVISKNKDKIDYWKVSVPAVAGGSKGNRRSTVPLNQIFLIPKGTITTETYNIIDVFESRDDAEGFINYLKTDFVRYLLGLRKMTQHIPKDRWNWVPYVDISKKWTDDELFSLFQLT